MDKISEMSGRSAARDTILQAFADIILESGYEKVRVLDIVERSRVARSTFYEHFQSREDLLRDSMRGPFDVLAQLTAPACDLCRVASMLDHVRHNRALTTCLMRNPGMNALIDLLAEVIDNHARAPMPAIASRAIAGAQLAMISSWLDGEESHSANDLARVLQAATIALLGAVRNSGKG